MTATHRRVTRQISPWATGLALFASVMMIVIGVFHTVTGLVALLNDEFFVRLPDYTFELDITGWGWIHLIGGVLVAWAGIGVLSGRAWARGVGIALAALSAVANFLWIPYYPFWSIIVIAVDVAVIWALTQYSAEALAAE